MFIQVAIPLRSGDGLVVCVSTGSHPGTLS